METILDIVALISFVLIIISLPNAVSAGTLQPSRSRILTGFIAAVAIVFATISLAAASGLAATHSSIAHLGVVIALVIIAAICRASFVPKTLAP